MSTPFETSSCSACGSWWKLPLLLAVVLAAIMIGRTWGIRNADLRPGDKPPAPGVSDQSFEQVALTIHPGDVRQMQHATSKWHEGMTVGDLLNEVRRVDVVRQGSGESAFVAGLNGFANEGSGGRNWLYSVNGQRADRSFGVYELKPDDHVLWIFAEPE
jgi:hypothetical protein